MTTWNSRMLAVLILGCLTACGPAPTAAPSEATPVPSVASSAASRPARARITYPAEGDRQYRIAAGGRKTPGLRYRVAVESDIRGIDPDDFARQVSTTLADPRGWRVPLRRVGPGQSYDFTIYLVTPGTRDALCADHADGYTSCRHGDRVVLNVARWVQGVPRINLSAYRQYMVNHEVGHRLGHGHELCPGPGEPAPVMQQQTLGLHGCTPNSWPRVDGKRYDGPSGAYDDPVPAQDRGRR